MSLDNCGDELGMVIRIRQCLELMDNGGAAASIDSLTQLIDETEADFDTDTTARRILPTVLGFLNQARQAIRNLLAECDNVGFAVLRNRLAADIDSVALSQDIYGLVGDFDHYLRDNSKKVLESSVTAGSSITAGGTNTGTGTIKVDVLDTWNKDNQSIQNADYWLTCTADAVTGGRNQHAEQFSLQSSFGVSVTDITACMYPGEDGEGDRGGGNRLQNEDGITTPGTGNTNYDTTIPFENFTSNTPDCWTIDTGTHTNNVLEEATEYYFGSKCLEFLGDAGSTKTEISQDANHFFGATSTDQKLDPLAHYAIGFYMKSSDTTGKISAYMAGTAYSAGTTEKATYDFNVSGALASWTLVAPGVVKMPKAIPTDMKYVIKVETALGNGVSAYIDGAFLAKMYHSETMGINFAVIPSSTAFVYDERDPDRLKFASTNDHAGLFQEWFSRRTDPRDIAAMKYADIGMHVTSDSSASNELLDSKAE